MIIDIPTSKEFRQSALDLLNTAWSQVSELLVEFDQVSELVELDELKSTDQYWKAAKQTMLITLTLTQQAVEFFIKGRIVSVSSHLLLDGSISSWPRRCDQEDILFSDFKTIDAQELIKAHDTVCVSSERFDDKFKQWYNHMRSARNKVMHSLANDITVTPEELLENILYAHKYFLPSNSWVKDRKKFLKNTPVNSIEYLKHQKETPAYILDQIYNELTVVVKKLKPAIVTQYFNFDKKRWALICPDCFEWLRLLDQYEVLENENDLLHSFQQGVNKKKHKCFICGYKEKVSFSKQACVECKHTLVDLNSGICLKCGFE